MEPRRNRWRSGREAWMRLRAWLEQAVPGDGSDALDALDDVGRLRRLLEQVELAAVRAARRRGHSWAEIATRLGVTRQSAWERWRDLDEVAYADPPRTSSDPETVREVEAAAAAELVARTARERRRRSTVTVPDVVGLSFDDARTVLVKRGLVAVGPDPDRPPPTASGWPGGVVTDQSPESGAKVPDGSRVTLWLGHGGGSGGVREPRRPVPGPKSLRDMRDEPEDEAVG